MVLALSVLSLAGCKTMESALKPLDSALNPKSDKQILSDKMDNWSQKKARNSLAHFPKGIRYLKNLSRVALEELKGCPKRSLVN
jgi:hypothetical protein